MYWYYIYEIGFMEESFIESIYIIVLFFAIV